MDFDFSCVCKALSADIPNKDGVYLDLISWYSLALYDKKQYEKVLKNESYLQYQYWSNYSLLKDFDERHAKILYENCQFGNKYLKIHDHNYPKIKLAFANDPILNKTYCSISEFNNVDLIFDIIFSMYSCPEEFFEALNKSTEPLIGRNVLSPYKVKKEEVFATIKNHRYTQLQISEIAVKDGWFDLLLQKESLEDVPI